RRRRVLHHPAGDRSGGGGGRGQPRAQVAHVDAVFSGPQRRDFHHRQFRHRLLPHTRSQQGRSDPPGRCGDVSREVDDEERGGRRLAVAGSCFPPALAAVRQVCAIVLNAMSYRMGNYTIEFTSNFPDDIITLPLVTERLILDGVRRIEYWSLITRGLGRFDRLLQQVPGADTRTYNVELDEQESDVLNLLSEPATVESVCARSYLSNFFTCRILWGLLSVNMLQEAESGAMDER